MLTRGLPAGKDPGEEALPSARQRPENVMRMRGLEPPRVLYGVAKARRHHQEFRKRGRGGLRRDAAPRLGFLFRGEGMRRAPASNLVSARATKA
jgi:hypothetical protein